MRILHVIHSVDPRSGGPSHALRAMVRAQVDAGHEIGVLSTTTQSAEPWARRDEFTAAMRSDAAFDGARLDLVRAYGRRRPFSRYAYTPGSTRWFRERFSDRASAPEVVHVHGVFSHLATRAVRCSKAFRIPCVVRPAGALDASCMRRGSRILKRVFVDTLLREDLRAAAFVQATSASEESELRRHVVNGRIVQIPHGVDVPSSISRSDGERFVERHPLLDGRTILLFLARVHEIKRPELLVRALALLKDERPDLALVIAGNDAGHLPLLQKTIAECGLDADVVLTGFVSGTEKAATFAAARVFALPSAHENFGVAVVEAMAHGVPVLVTPGVASHVYVDASGGGVTVTDDIAGIADGIRRLLSMDRDEVGLRGRNYVREHLSWPAVVDRLDALYRRAVHDNRVRHGH